jgi:hypothetical protein
MQEFAGVVADNFDNPAVGEEGGFHSVMSKGAAL